MLPINRLRTDEVATGLSLYLHIPFCKTRCSYCDFNTYTNLSFLYGRYANALGSEIERTLAQVAAGTYNPLQPLPLVSEPVKNLVPISTIFFGGGTPSLLPPILLEKVMQAIRRQGQILPDAEITAEANPGTLSLEKLRALRNMGINRLSFGVQTFDDALLRSLGRTHNAAEAVEAFHQARRAGFDNMNLDFIYGLPGQTLKGWRATLERAISLQPEHLSLYALTIEENTAMGRALTRGAIPSPDDDLLADMYLLAIELLGAAGYTQYEISNWALNKYEVGSIKSEKSNKYQVTSNNSEFGSMKSESLTNNPNSIVNRQSSIVNPGNSQLATSYRQPTTDNPSPPLACQHNLVYWRNQPYIGFGPGAHSSFGGYRYAVLNSPQEYIERLKQGESVIMLDEAEPTTSELNLADSVILALRLNEGLELAKIEREFGKTLDELFPGVVETLTRFELLEKFEGANGEARLGLTVRGRLLSNEVFIRFLPD